MFGMSSDYPRIVFLLAEAIQGFPVEILTSEFRGRRSTWWVSRVTLLAPRIVNDVSYVTRINDWIHFAWQAQYSVKLECDFSWRAQHFVTFWEIAGARNVVFFNTKSSSPRSDREGLRSGGCEMTMLCSDYVRIMFGMSSDYPRIVFLLAEAIQGFPVEIFDLRISWQAQYLVSLKGDFTCSAHCKWRHMSRGSMIRFILRGRRSIWWSWSVTFRGRRSISWHFGR